MTRADVLRDLIAFRRPVGELRQLLRAYPWDSEELASLDVDDVVRVLDSFAEGALSSEEVADWADAIEVRDDIAISPTPPALREVILALATPELEGPLTRETAAAWRAQLT